MARIGTPEPRPVRAARAAARLALALLAGRASAQEQIAINAAVTYQTMRGWEATAEVLSECDPNFASVRDALVAAAVDEVGIDRLRLEVKSGAENTTDHYANWVAAGCPEPPDPAYTTWRQSRYATVNDNADPFDLDPSGFRFTELDHRVQEIVLPMKQAVEANGEQLFINLTYVAFTDQIVGGTYLHDDPDEYAEFVLATYQHLDSTYGFVPDSWEVVLEPDNVAQWDGALLGQAVVATAARLQAAGYSPAFVAPSDASMARAIAYFDDMIAVPGALAWLQEFSYHRYGGVSVANLQAIASRATTHGLHTSMLEWWFGQATHDVLYEDLTIGRNASWQGRALVGLFDIEPSPVQLTIRNDVRFNRQYFRWVRQGAVRIDAQSTGSDIDPVAFINADGTTAVVLDAAAGQSFDITGLPPGTYALSYTTESEYDASLPPVALGPGQVLSGSIPAAGVLTVRELAVAPTAVPTLPLPGKALAVLVVAALGVAHARQRWR